MTTSRPYNSRLRIFGVAFIILGIVFANEAIKYIRIKAGAPAYIMLAACIMMILSGIYRVWRSGKA